ncbi:hypothetical protein AB0B44_43430, partial [Streptomyces sp. NPDC041003]
MTVTAPFAGGPVASGVADALPEGPADPAPAAAVPGGELPRSAPGAPVTYYGVLALFPALLVLVSL